MAVSAIPKVGRPEEPGQHAAPQPDGGVAPPRPRAARLRRRDRLPRRADGVQRDARPDAAVLADVLREAGAVRRIGFVVLAVTTLVDYRVFRDWALFLYFGACGLLALVVSPLRVDEQGRAVVVPARRLPAAAVGDRQGRR